MSKIINNLKKQRLKNQARNSQPLTFSSSKFSSKNLTQTKSKSILSVLPKTESKTPNHYFLKTFKTQIYTRQQTNISQPKRSIIARSQYLHSDETILKQHIRPYKKHTVESACKLSDFSEMEQNELQKFKPTKSHSLQTEFIKINQKSIPATKKIIQNKEQISKLRINDLVFCTKCFQYVFKIEFQYHIPQCKYDVHKLTLNHQQMQELGEQKLNILKHLMQYTQNQAVLNMIDKIYKKKFKLKQFKNQYQLKSFYLIDQAEEALILLFQQFFNH